LYERKNQNKNYGTDTQKFYSELMMAFSNLFLRYLIPNAGDATKAIKQQIMKVLDALES